MKNRPSDDGMAATHHRGASAPHLRFNQTLSWKAGRLIPVGDLLKRLQALANEMKDMDQEEMPRDALAVPAAELANRSLLEHKDKGVKAWTACCLVDVLRLCAPEAPYTAMQLKASDIFSLFINAIIPSLSDPASPYNSQHLYVLNSLSQVKSIVLLTDVPGASGLILNLFKTCFDVLSTAREDLSKNVEYYMTGLLNCMIDECQGLPTEVVEIILAQFMHADPNARSSLSRSKKSGAQPSADDSQSKLQRQVPSSYHLAKNLCNTCADRMSRYVSHYFSSMIMDSTFSGNDKPSKSKRRARASSEESDELQPGHQGPTEDDMKQLERAHRLLRELWRSCPGVLPNVIPQVEAEISAENVQLRLLATETMGDMAAGIGIAGDATACLLNPAAFPAETLADENAVVRVRSVPQSFLHTQVGAYQQFLGRRNDKSAHIRAAWTRCIGRVLASSAGGVGLEATAETEMAKYISHMLVDSDEKVRIAAIEAIGLFSLKDFIDKLGPLGGVDEAESILHNLADRTKDRKAPVRSEAIQLLGKLWGAASGEIAAGNSKVKTLLGSVPSTVLNAYYVNDRETHCFIDRALFESLVPFGYPAVKKKDKSAARDTPSQGAADTTSGTLDVDKIRTERILLVLNGLDEKARRVFFTLIGRSQKQGPYMDAFLKCCETFNGGVVEKETTDVKQRLSKLNDYLSAWTLDAAQAREHLNTFAKMHDRRSYILIRFCMAADADYSKVYKSLRELERRMTGFPPQNAAVFETLRPLILRVSNVFENRSHIRPILEISRTDEKSLGNAANDLLNHITTTNPAVFKTHAEELFRTIQTQAPTATSVNDPSALDSLKACSSFAKRFPEDIPTDRKFLQSMMQYAQHGSPPATAKHAVSVLMYATEKKQMYAKDLLHKCVEDFEYGAPSFLTKLACLSQLMLMAAEELEDDLDGVTDIAIHQILNKVRRPDTDDEEKWQDEPDQECQAKLWALKILVNRLRSYEDPQAIKDIYEQVYRMLDLLISRRGELFKNSSTPQSHRSRLYLQAAKLYLKLSTKRGFDSLLSPASFNELALTAQTSIYQVRLDFIKKSKKLLALDKLPIRFYCPFFLLAHEPTSRLRAETATWLHARATALAATAARSHAAPERLPVVELLFARLLSLLAHHPDFSTETSDLTAFAQYILYYLKSVAMPTNISLIYAVAQKVKGVQDKLTVDEAYDGDLNASTNLYVLSDLAQAVIRAYEEEKNWSLQADAMHISLPSSIFKAMPSTAVAQETARKNYLPSDFVDEVDGIVKASLRNNTSKKRKSDTDISGSHAAKKRSTAQNARQPKTPSHRSKRRKTNAGEDDEDDLEADEDGAAAGPDVPSSERRKSGRSAAAGKRKSYADTRESDDEKDMLEWERADEDIESDADADANVDANGDADAGAGPEEDDVAMTEADAALDAELDAADDDEDEIVLARKGTSAKSAANNASDANDDDEEEEDIDNSTSSKENTTTRSPNDDTRARTRTRRKSAASPKTKPTTTVRGKTSKAIPAPVSKTKAKAATATAGKTKAKAKGNAQAAATKGKTTRTSRQTQAHAQKQMALVQRGDEFDVPMDSD